jgi:hypothetical protein
VGQFELINKDIDQPAQISPSTPAWPEDEVDTWQQARIDERNGERAGQNNLVDQSLPNSRSAANRRQLLHPDAKPEFCNSEIVPIKHK